MGLKNLSHCRCKLMKPCNKLLQLFKFKLHKPLSIRALWVRPRRNPNITGKGPRRRLSRILPALCSLTRTKEMDRATEFTSFSDPGQRIAPHPSPLTPAYARIMRTAEATRKVDVSNDQYAACSSLENHLMEMIVGEGKTRDLVDAEEFLHCWNKLSCPVFMDLVCRFYGELCRDLFSNACGSHETGESNEYLLYK